MEIRSGGLKPTKASLFRYACRPMARLHSRINTQRPLRHDSKSVWSSQATDGDDGDQRHGEIWRNDGKPTHVGGCRVRCGWTHGPAGIGADKQDKRNKHPSHRKKRSKYFTPAHAFLDDTRRSPTRCFFSALFWVCDGAVVVDLLTSLELRANHVESRGEDDL